MDLLEQKCSKMILDCVDWQNMSSDALHDIGHMYDMLYSVYCAKLGVDGQEYSVEQALRESVDEGRRAKEDSTSFGSKKK